MKSRFSIVLTAIVILSLLVRLYKINSPIADWHSFRQADTASVTREFVKHGIDLLHPKYHDLSNIQSGENNNGKDNVQGWRMVEFPIVNGTLALVLRTFPQIDLVTFSRFASVLASLASLIFLSLICKRVYGKKVGLLAAFFFGILPYSIYYSRVVLPEPFLVTSVLTSLWMYQTYVLSKKAKWVIFSAIFFGLALLIKPMAVFFIPIYIGLRFKDNFRIRLDDLVTGVLFGLNCLPLLWWRHWILQYPTGIPISAWLYNGVGKGTNLLPVYKIRFKPAWWRWIFYERLTKLFLGYIGGILFALGCLWATLKKDLFFLSWAVGGFLYVSVFAAGNVQHDYYQILLVPFVAITLALGCVLGFKKLRSRLNAMISFTIITLIIAASLLVSWNMVKGYYQINNWAIVTAGKEADRILPKDALVIAPYTGDTAFLFQTNRRGWPVGGDLSTKISEGAQYYVSVNYDDETNALIKKYAVVESTKLFVIIDLTHPKKIIAPAL